MVDFNFRSHAIEDLLKVTAWYEEKQNGLGKEFLNCFEEGLKFISEFPESSPVVYNEIRRKILKRFPYSIYYITLNKKIIILRIINQKRNPQPHLN